MIEVAANFTGSVENHGCFIPWGACRPVREGWGFRASVAGKVDPGGGHTLLQTVCFARDIAYGDAVDVMEYERNLGTMPCGFSAIDREFIGKLIGIGRRFCKLRFLTNEFDRCRTEERIHRPQVGNCFVRICFFKKRNQFRRCITIFSRQERNLFLTVHLMFSRHNRSKIKLTDVGSCQHRNRFGVIRKSALDRISAEPAVLHRSLSDIAAFRSNLCLNFIVRI